MRTILEKEGILSLEDWQIDKLAYSFCRNCKKEERKIRLYDGKWIHVEMGGGMYYLPGSYYSCESPEPLNCKKCGSPIDYKTTDVSYYDFLCGNCLSNYHNTPGDKIGIVTMELRQQLEAGTHPHLKYGTSCSVVITPRGIFFEDIC